ncbi:hypothetical protein [Xanthomonas melonis]|uniref:hypothetical protein n=1 Tax=Xanthomonas melonis TaxID=56456 RepID=UPI003EBEA7D7
MHLRRILNRWIAFLHRDKRADRAVCDLIVRQFRSDPFQHFRQRIAGEVRALHYIEDLLFHGFFDLITGALGRRPYPSRAIPDQTVGKAPGNAFAARFTAAPAARSLHGNTETRACLGWTR